MAGIQGLSSGPDYSALFATSGQKDKSADYSSILNLDLADVASVRNGSYGKLLKNYYREAKAGAKEVDGDTDAKLTSIKEDADKLVAAADKLNNSKLYETKTTKDENGKTKEEFADSDKLVSAVKDFVNAYNAAIDSAGDSETKSVLRTGGWMAGMTKQNVNMLGDVGITVGEDDKLRFDEETFKKANVTTVKDVFSGVNSYASQVGAKAASISRATQNTEAMYSDKGKWTSSVNSLAESAISKVTGDTDKEEKTETVASGSEKEKKTLTEADSEKLKELQEKRDKLMKEYEKLDSVEKIKDYDTQLAAIDKEMTELGGGN